MYQLAVFDIAGTTVDEGAAVYEAMRSALAGEGVEVGDRELDLNKGRDKRTALTDLLSSAGHDADTATVDRVYEAFSTTLREAYDRRPPVAMPGARECLATLRGRGMKLALSTGYTREVAESVLAHAGLTVGPEGDVDVLVSTSEVAAARPAPYLIHHAMELTGVQDVRAVISAGDTIADVRSHRNAGVTSVAVLSGDTDEDTLRSEGPDHVLGSVAELPALLG